MIFEFACIVCGSHVRVRRSPANSPKAPRFCSQRCNGKHRKGTGSGLRPTHEFNCENCGRLTTVYRSPSQSKKHPPRFCSLACLGANQEREGNPSYTGGRYIDSNGYVHVLRPDHPGADCRGYVYEHRVIAEAAIGRILLTTEIVHHKNEIKSDNSPQNLQVFKSQSAHLKHHGERRHG